MPIGVRGRGRAGRGRRLAALAIVALLLMLPGGGWAADPSPAASGNMMNSAGWLGRVTMKLEAEATSDVGMLPDTSAALAREWRSFDRNGSALGALGNFGWIIVAAILAWGAERGVARAASRRLRRTMRVGSDGPTVSRLLLLLLCDLIGVAVFGAVFTVSRHWLVRVGVTVNLIALASDWLVRWRLICLVPRIVLRPAEPAARLIEIADDEAHRLARFLSGAMLAIVVLIGFGRYGLADEDSGAPHIIGLVVALVVCSIDALIVLRSRAAAEALIRGHTGGVVGALRAAIANAWLPIGLTAVGGLFLFFVFGLSLGLLSYYHAIVSTLGLMLVVLVLERLAERGWHDAAGGGVDRLVRQSLRRILSAVILLVVALTLAWVWIKPIEMAAAAARRAMYSAVAAGVMLLIAFVVWELTRLAIDRHLQNVATGPRLPGDDDDESGPGSRLQTILPMLRAAFGVLIAVVVVLVVLSRLGIDTAPLIAGAGVFGLAISFGAQSLVRDIISGLFYLWDDAFRVGEYIDTGRLKGTVESLGIRSVKLRHHNGPLHTIPYGQLGAVTNLSRDFATIKFNLRLERGTDIELVRKTAKRIGLDMQEENPEIAAEVMLPLKMQGIAEVTDTAVVLRFKFTARPVKPSWVQREYLKAMYRVFAEKGIAFAVGALTLQSAPPRPGPAAEGEPAPPALVEALPAQTRVA